MGEDKWGLQALMIPKPEMSRLNLALMEDISDCAILSFRACDDKIVFAAHGQKLLLPQVNGMIPPFTPPPFPATIPC